VNIAQLHGQVIKALIAEHGHTLTVYATDGDKAITMATFQKTQKLWDEAFHMTKVTNSRNDKAIIIAVLQIAMTLHEIRQ
jgi:hypothetical protein